MSDELNAMQETALQARAQANELKAALTDESSDEERSAAEEAEKAAADAESVFAEARAKAEAEAEAEAKAKAEAEAAAQGGKVSVDGSRTGFVENGQPGGVCICPDGRKGTIHKFDAGLVCIPNDNQG